MATYVEAKRYVDDLLAKLDELADEDWIAESFIPEALVIEVGSNDYSVDVGTLVYGIEESGEDQLALDFRKWYNNQKEFILP